MESLQTLVAMSVRRGSKLHHNHTIPRCFMRQPKSKGRRIRFVGLKQSPRCWNSTLDDYLKELVYLSSDGEMVVAVDVDDIIVAGKIKKPVDDFK